MNAVREDVPPDIEARLARIEAAMGELLAAWKGSAGEPRPDRELAAADRIAELERTLENLRKTGERAQARIAMLEAQLADVSGDLAEREHLVEELQQALRYERDLRKLREAERDRIRELFGYLQNSRWRRLGQAIGVVKTQQWERDMQNARPPQG
jgi:chromosome segregation ATPase